MQIFKEIVLVVKLYRQIYHKCRVLDTDHICPIGNDYFCLVVAMVTDLMFKNVLMSIAYRSSKVDVKIWYF